MMQEAKYRNIPGNLPWRGGRFMTLEAAKNWVQAAIVVKIGMAPAPYGSLGCVFWQHVFSQGCLQVVTVAVLAAHCLVIGNFLAPFRRIHMYIYIYIYMYVGSGDPVWVSWA